ncbi:serine/threonine-protein kinase [Micromonospora sp. NPDC049274]|uniref:serine/threonine-protein kinase n=1 Tax=Micromonospora sp. NPDC049274 TaxID=3154829 RepID=UPI0034179EAD
MSIEGTRLAGRYRVTARLGAGGHGTVYAAQDERLRRLVAVKLLNEDADPELLARFQREAEILAMIKHPNVVAIFDVGRHDDGAAFVVMEHLAGPDLAHVQFDAGCLSVAQTLRYAVPVADALVCLHEHPTPVIHRDLKPQNLVLDADGTIKICDFGVSTVPEAMLTRLTRPGMVLGTAAYMSPEQWRGDAPDRATDIYSLGAVLYALLAGGPPLRMQGGPATCARRVEREAPESIVDRCPSVPPALADLIHAMLAKSAAARPTARAVRDALRATATADAARSPAGDVDPAVQEGDLLLAEGRYAEAARHFTDLAHRLRDVGDVDPVARVAAEFGRVRSRFGLGEEAVASLRLVRLAARARAALGDDHPLVRQIHAYLDVKSR